MSKPYAHFQFPELPQKDRHAKDDSGVPRPAGHLFARGRGGCDVPHPEWQREAGGCIAARQTSCHRHFGARRRVWRGLPGKTIPAEVDRNGDSAIHDRLREKGNLWFASSIKSLPLPSFLSPTCFLVWFESKKISWIDSSISARNAWPGFSCCLRVLARKVETELHFPESIRNNWPKWSAPPGRGSVIS